MHSGDSLVKKYVRSTINLSDEVVRHPVARPDPATIILERPHPGEGCDHDADGAVLRGPGKVSHFKTSTDSKKPRLDQEPLAPHQRTIKTTKSLSGAKQKVGRRVCFIH